MANRIVTGLLAAAALLMTTSGATSHQRYDFALESFMPRAMQVVIVKGGTDIAAVRAANPRALVFNYEQSFALNPGVEEPYARARGWLARTCSGNEIHPKNLPKYTLMDATISAAVDWRSSRIADETVAKNVEGSYLDTLRSHFPTEFYDGVPCNLQHKQWLDASIAMVDQVAAKTGGRPVIINGSGLQSGKNYFEHQAVANQLIARGWGVQIEQFLRRRRNAAADVSFLRSLGARGKRTFAKCAGRASDCVRYFTEGANPLLSYLRV